jgi:hypothetical protein
MTTEIVETIMDQIKILDPFLFLSSNKIVVNAKTLRLWFKERRTIYKVDIRYNCDIDLYDIVIYRITNFNNIKIKEMKSIFCEQITQVIRDVIK